MDILGSRNVDASTFAAHRKKFDVQYMLNSEPYQPHSIPPNWGGHAVTGSLKFSPVTTSPPRESFDNPKMKYEALEISIVRGPFERNVLMHYSYFGPL